MSFTLQFERVISHDLLLTSYFPERTRKTDTIPQSSTLTLVGYYETRSLHGSFVQRTLEVSGPNG